MKSGKGSNSIIPLDKSENIENDSDDTGIKEISLFDFIVAEKTAFKEQQLHFAVNENRQIVIAFLLGEKLKRMVVINKQISGKYKFFEVEAEEVQKTNVAEDIFDDLFDFDGSDSSDSAAEERA